MSPSPPHRGFTLVELLVVVAIVVVLLALLAPALDKAVYQAQLVQCAGNQKSVAAAVHQYAFDHQRVYPDRNIVGRQSPGLITPTLLASHIPDTDGRPYDVRPQLRKYIRINDQLNDPFVEPVDVDYIEPVPSTLVFASYGMYFGWTFTPANGGPGMMRLGDRWTWNQRQHSLLLGDWELLWNPANISAGPSSAERYPVPIYLGNATQSYWISAERERGMLDMNYASQDGSVRRLDHVLIEDARLTPTPYYSNGNNAATFRVYVPRE
jgi:prepilin-type N-terminal cleavage/methylation domain-containing protein